MHQYEIKRKQIIFDFFKVNIEDLFAFHYNPKEEELIQSAGWAVYDAQTEFGRMEVPPKLWVQTKLNKEYKVCSMFCTGIGHVQYRNQILCRYCHFS